MIGRSVSSTDIVAGQGGGPQSELACADSRKAGDKPSGDVARRAPIIRGAIDRG